MTHPALRGAHVLLNKGQTSVDGLPMVDAVKLVTAFVCVYISLFHMQNSGRRV